MPTKARRDGRCSAKDCVTAADGAVFCDVHAEAHSKAMLARYRAKKGGRSPCIRCSAPMPSDEESWVIRLCPSCRKVPAPSKAPEYRRRSRFCQRCGTSVAGTRKSKWCRPCALETVHRSVTAKAFGMAPGEYDALLELQSNRCAICLIRKDRKRLSVDHDHESGAVRGLLCSRCNTGLGMFSDSRGVLYRAMAYLEAPPAKTRKAIFLTDVVIPDDAVQGRK